MVWIAVEDSPISMLRRVEVFLLLMHMADLEPDVLLCQRAWRVVYDVFEAVQTLGELLLLLIYYAESKVDLVRLFKSWLHRHDLRKGFFRMLQRAVAVI